MNVTARQQREQPRTTRHAMRPGWRVPYAAIVAILAFWSGAAPSAAQTATSTTGVVSDNVVGDNFLQALPSATVPLPAESVEEFSVATTNANATFGRGSGGQFVIVTKRGTNDFRGSGYWYTQNDASTFRPHSGPRPAARAWRRTAC